MFVCVCVSKCVLHGVFFASWTEKNNLNLEFGKSSRVSGVIKGEHYFGYCNRIAFLLLFFHSSAIHEREREKVMGEGRGDGAGERRASKRASTPAEECKRENKAEEKKNKERSRRETEGGERKSIPCLEERPTPKVQLC